MNNDGRLSLADSFRALFDEHADYVLKSLLRLGVRPGDAEDVMHEVFVAVLRRDDAFDPTRPVKPWLFAFARGFASSYRQSAYVKRTRFAEVEDEGAAAKNAEELLTEHEESAVVHRALDALDDDKRVVFVMFELDERSAADIAKELEISPNTVFSRLRAAREEFTAAVKRLTLASRNIARPSRVSP